MSTHRTLVDIVRARATETPDRVGYVYLDDGELQETPLTYGELDRRARRIAVVLNRVGPPGERALLLYVPSLDYICAYFGCLLAGWIPVPAYPPDPMRLPRTLPRIQGIMRDATPIVALTTSDIEAIAEPILTESTLYFGAMSTGNLAIIATDHIPVGTEEHWRPPVIDPETVALLQYTSGSVGQPKGVIVTHGNLLHNLSIIADREQPPEGTTGVTWLPPYHDMGLIGGILNPLYSRYLAYHMSPLHFLMRPMRWLKALSRYRCHSSMGPNFGYALCVRRARPEDKKEIDLSTMRVFFHGAEPIRADVIDAFVDTFGPCGFRRETFLPCYGLAETTLIATGMDKGRGATVRRISVRGLAQGAAVEVGSEDPDGTTIVSCGHPLTGGEVRIVDPEHGHELAVGQVGEIWLRSPSVAKGYWGNPEQSHETFGAMLEGSGPYLRTGDLGFMLHGDLHVVGRLKDVIILQARNIYPHEIEVAVENSHGSIRRGCVAAVSIDLQGEERLVVICEVDRRAGGERRKAPSEPPDGERRQTDRRMRPLPPGEEAADPKPFDIDAVADAIREAISRHLDTQVSIVVFIRPGTIFKTPSGKIQRQLCRTSFLQGALEVIAERRYGV